MQRTNKSGFLIKKQSVLKNSLSLWVERWLCSSDAKDIGTLPMWGFEVMQSTNKSGFLIKKQSVLKNSLSLWMERWLCSSNAKDIGTLYLIFALFSGLIATAFSVLQVLYKKVYPFIEWAKNSPPKPHAFVSLPLQSNMDTIFLELDTLLPQILNFTQQFNSTVIQYGINVITDVAGNLAIEVPGDMSDLDVKTVTNKIGIIDRLINTQAEKAAGLINQGLNLYKLGPENAENIHKLHQNSKILQELLNSYKH